jgi:hypothetical protein
MDRSLRFRVYPHGLNALFRLAFAPAPSLRLLASPARSNSPDHNAKGTQSPPQHPKVLRRLPPLVGTRFQVLFHSPPGVLFTFPSRYSFTIGRGRVFSLGGWSPRIQSGLLGAPNLLRYLCHTSHTGSPTGLSPAVAGRSRPLRLPVHDRAGKPHTGPTTPDPRRGLVWALPRSLAATCGISLDFSSCRYLDVSVPRVGSPLGVTGLSTCRVSPFGNPWITGYVLLPMAYRSLPRPSSPARAQASPVCPYCA